MTRYAVSFETIVDVVNALEFTAAEIEEELRRDLAREISDNGTRDERTRIHPVLVGRPDYGLRLVRRPYGIDSQRPDDPVETIEYSVPEPSR